MISEATTAAEARPNHFSAFSTAEFSASVPTFADVASRPGTRLGWVEVEHWLIKTNDSSMRLLMSGHGLSDYEARDSSDQWYHKERAYGWYYMRIIIDGKAIAGNDSGLVIPAGQEATKIVFEFYASHGEDAERLVPPRHKNRICAAAIIDNDHFATSLVQFSMQVGEVAAPAPDLGDLVLDEDAPATVRLTVPPSRDVLIAHEPHGIVITAKLREAIEVDAPPPDEIDAPAVESAPEVPAATKEAQSEELVVEEPEKSASPPKRRAEDQGIEKPAPKNAPKRRISDAEGEAHLQPSNVTVTLNGKDFEGKAVVKVTWESPPQSLGDAKDGKNITAEVTDPDRKVKYRKMVNRADALMVDGVPIVNGLAKVRLTIYETADGEEQKTAWSDVLVPMMKPKKT